MSYRAESCKNRKWLIVLLLGLLALPALASGRWVAFGPDSTLQVTAIRSDLSDPHELYIASNRGVFVSHDNGGQWRAISNGLHGFGVLALQQAISGTWVAGTDHGIFLLPPDGAVWRPSNAVVNEQGTPRVISVKGVTRRVMTHHPTRTVLQARINDLEIAPNRWLAATSAGIFSSSDQGKIWSGGPVNGEKEFIAVKAEKELVVVSTRSKLFVSTDGGTVWKQAVLSPTPAAIYSGVILGDRHIFAATREGLFRSADAGASWEHLTKGIPSHEIGSIAFDSTIGRLIAYSNESGFIFQSGDKGQSWQHIDEIGPGVQHLNAANGRLFAATAEGFVAGPDDPKDQSADANHVRGNWFLRLVHLSQQ